MPSTATSRRRPMRADFQLVSVEDLSGGLDLRKAATLIKPNRSRACRNWSLREPGALIVFPGWASHSTTSLGSGRPQGAQRIYLAAGAPFTVAAFNGGVYKPTDGGVWGSALTVGWSSSNAIHFPYDRDIVAIFDGANVPHKSTDGSTWTAMGIAVPGTPTAANLAGGSLVSGNQYEFSYTGRDDALLHESSESVRVTHTPSGANLSVRLTLPRHTDAQVDTLVVYGRDVTAGEPIRRRIGTVANPGAGSATFDVTTNNWSSGVEAPSDHTVPVAMAFGVVWKNRWWGKDATVGNRVRFTQIFEAQSWPSTFTIDIPFERGDEITAFLPLGDTLLVFGQSKVFLIIGQTSLDFEVRPAGASQAGALGARAVAAVEEGAIHAAAEGIYLFDGATDRLLSHDIDGFAPSAIGWRSYVSTASQADLAKTPLVYHQAAKEVAIAVSSLYPYGTAGEWILDLNRTRVQETPAWTTTDRTIGGYISWDGDEPTAGNRGRLFSWSNTIGKLFEERTGTTADGADLVASYEGPVFTHAPVVGRLINSFVDVEPNSGTFGLELVVDNVSRSTQNIDVSGGGPILGTAILGTATLVGSGRKTKPVMWPLSAEGTSFQVRATYTGQAAFRWFAYRTGLLPEPVPREL